MRRGPRIAIRRPLTRDGGLLALSLRPGQATQHCKGMDARQHEKRSTRLRVRGGSKTDLGRGNVVQGRHDIIR